MARLAAVEAASTGPDTNWSDFGCLQSSQRASSAGVRYCVHLHAAWRACPNAAGGNVGRHYCARRGLARNHLDNSPQPPTGFKPADKIRRKITNRTSRPASKSPPQNRRLNVGAEENRRASQMRNHRLRDRRRNCSLRAQRHRMKAGAPRLDDLNVFSAGFAPGVLGTYISAWLTGTAGSPDFA